MDFPPARTPAKTSQFLRDVNRDRRVTITDVVLPGRYLNSRRNGGSLSVDELTRNLPAGGVSGAVILQNLNAVPSDGAVFDLNGDRRSGRSDARLIARVLQGIEAGISPAKLDELCLR